MIELLNPLFLFSRDKFEHCIFLVCLFDVSSAGVAILKLFQEKFPQVAESYLLFLLISPGFPAFFL